jgi:hypothetical protein
MLFVLRCIILPVGMMDADLAPRVNGSMKLASSVQRLGTVIRL